MRKSKVKNNPPQRVIAEDMTENHTAKRYFLIYDYNRLSSGFQGGDHEG